MQILKKSPRRRSVADTDGNTEFTATVNLVRLKLFHCFFGANQLHSLVNLNNSSIVACSDSYLNYFLCWIIEFCIMLQVKKLSFGYGHYAFVRTLLCHREYRDLMFHTSIVQATLMNTRKCRNFFDLIFSHKWVFTGVLYEAYTMQLLLVVAVMFICGRFVILCL